MSKRKNVIRVNDVVKIVNPEFVVRVGYPLSKKMIQSSLTHEQLALVKAIFNQFDISTDALFDSSRPPSEGERAYEKVLDILSGVLLAKKLWGGSQRSIHTELIEKHRDIQCTVMEKRFVKTGKYQPGWSSVDYWGEYDYEPAYLEDEKTHALLRVNIYDYETVLFGTYLEIEAKNVVKMKQNPQTYQWEEIETYARNPLRK